MAHKAKLSRALTPNDVKAEIIRKHGTIAAFARRTGFRVATVYAAIKSRRNGPLSKIIRAHATR